MPPSRADSPDTPARAPESPGTASRSQVEVRRLRVEEGEGRASLDRLAAEEPLEIRLRAGGEERTVAVTMRTPGADAELALGFLYAEGVIRRRDEVARIEALDDPWGTAGEPSNVLAVELAAGELPELGRLERHFFTTSACGVCGKAGIESLRLAGVEPPSPGPRVSAELVYSLPERLRAAQGLFSATGGLHAAALFSAAGELLAVREDVGRHNALDKLVGWALENGRLPLTDGMVLVSGRSSFEILQKCLMAGVPVVAAVSAPSSLAVELARQFDVTLIGFLRQRRFNVYSGEERLVAEPAAD